MKMKKILSLALALTMMTACAPKESTVQEETTAVESVTTVASAEAMSNETPPTIDTPEINDVFSSELFIAQKRGTVLLRYTEDEAASDGGALRIFNRTSSWNGMQYDAEKFRGNDIEVKGSFRSANPSVKLSIEYSVDGNTVYTSIATVNTNESTYTEGSGTFIVPKNADNILVYVECDKLEDIYCDSFSVRVRGDFTYYPEALPTEYVDTSDYPSMKELYGDYFRIGTATAAKLLEKEDIAKFVKSQFNSMTMGNSFKPDSILDHNKCVRNLDEYRYSPAVKFDSVKEELDFARDNGFTVRGHVLVWHSQTPDWFFYKDYNVGGELADRDTMLKRMESYIKQVVEWADENYPGLVSAWDVVNEAADDSSGMRKSLWYQTIGDDFVRQAFKFARKYAPEDVKLFYNDYNSFYTRKQKDIIAFLKPIVEDGNIDGMGMQSHVKVTDNVSSFMTALKTYYDELGLEINITELDVGRGSGDDWLQKQGDYYKEFMTYLIELDKSGIPITSVTLWGITDADSWRAPEYPLPFNGDLSTKPAFDGIVEAAENAGQ